MIGRRQLVDLSPEPRCDVWEQGVATGEHNVFEEVTSQCLVALHDAVVNVFLDALLGDVFSLSELGLEQDLRAAESLLTKDNLGPIRQLVSLLAGFRLVGVCKSRVK